MSKVITSKVNIRAFITWGIMLCVAFFIITGAIAFTTLTAHAQGRVRFGSNSYTPKANENFNIGVYIGNNEDNGLLVGTYSVTLTYDQNALTYVGGATTGGNGTVTVSGTSATGGESMHMLTFRANTQGNTSLSVASIAVNDTTGTPMVSAAPVSAPINVQAAAPAEPEYIMLNGKNIPGFAKGRTEYTFSIPYADELVIEAPEGFTLTTDARELKVGRNEIEVRVANGGADPIVYNLHVNMEKDKDADEKTSEEDSSEKEEKASETGKSEKASEKASEKKENKTSELILPPMPEENTSEDKGLLGEKKSLIILCGFGLLILVIVGIKFLFDAISSRRGRSSDIKNLTTKEKLRRQEKIDEASAPFEFATIDEKKAENAPKHGTVDLRLKSVEKTKESKQSDKPENKDTSGNDNSKDDNFTRKDNASGNNAGGREIPKLDFSKRVSASRMAREELAMEEKKDAEDHVGRLDEEEVEEYMQSLDQGEAADEGDFLDLDDVADRAPRK